MLAAAQLVASVPQLARGDGPGADQVARRLLTVTFAAVCFQPLYNAGLCERWFGDGPYYAAFLLLLLGLTALCDAVLAALLLRARTLPRGSRAAPAPYGPFLRDELRALTGIGSAVCATGAVMALGVAAAGLWALPVLCVPLLLTQLSFRRFAAVRTTYRQTIASLARSTEIAGYTPHGHARRVAGLCTAVGREMGLTGPELTVLEYAALMHDIGQLSLVDPVPDGATALLAGRRAAADRAARRGGGPPDRGGRPGRRRGGAAGRPLPRAAVVRQDRPGRERIRRPVRGRPLGAAGRAGTAQARDRARLPAAGGGIARPGSGQGRSDPRPPWVTDG